jgi:hypothetical protein
VQRVDDLVEVWFRLLPEVNLSLLDLLSVLLRIEAAMLYHTFEHCSFEKYFALVCRNKLTYYIDLVRVFTLLKLKACLIIMQGLLQQLNTQVTACIHEVVRLILINERTILKHVYR